MHVDLNSDMNSDPMSNFNTDGRTDGTKNITRRDSAIPCNARGVGYEKREGRTAAELLADDEAPKDQPTETDAQLMARLLGARERRNTPDSSGRTISQVLDSWLDNMALDAGRRWPVIRSGEREPIPWPLRASILERDDHTCRQCGWHDSEGFELDHCIPWSAGGPDDSDNLRTLCRHCNQSRSNFIDNAHITTTLPTTYWCIDCWTYENHKPRRFWRDGTDLTQAPWVASEDGGPMRLVYCASCHYISTSDVYFVGEMGRELLATATRFAKAVDE